MRRRSLTDSARVRILGAILSVAFVGLVLVGGVTFLLQRDRVLADVDTRLESQVSGMNVLADAGPTAAEADEATFDIADYASVSEYLSSVVSHLVTGPNEAAVALVDGAARFLPETLSGFDISDNDQLIDRALADTAGGGGAQMGTVATPMGTLRYIAVPVTMEGDEHTGLYIRAVDLDRELLPLRDAALTYSITAIATLIASGLVGWYVVGRLLGPLQRLRETADAINLNDLGARVATTGHDDISHATRKVDSMLDRLEGSFDAQRRLLDDVRHELKTPITVVRGHLETMDAERPDDVRTTREIGISELDRISRLVDDIDLLATVEGEQMAQDPIDLVALCARVGQLVTAIPGHTWRVHPPRECQLSGDEDRLLQAWLQLADNAAKHTPTGTEIEIGSDVEPDAALLWVRDHGDGVPPAARHRIFQRFARVNGRARTPGSGLGLAIVDTIARAHGGRCSVTDTPGGGATFTIHIPTTAETPALPEPVPAERSLGT